MENFECKSVIKSSLEEKEYYIPVNLDNIIAVKARTETEAINIIESELDKLSVENYCIDFDNITCNKDDEMIEQMAQDFENIKSSNGITFSFNKGDK